MESTWRSLRLCAYPDSCPPLFVRCDLDAAQYIVQLTDLGKIWEETLPRRGIVKRALENDTSIDPTEDAQQLNILLENIQNAIAGAQGTSRRLARSENALTLRLTAPLPPPLNAFQWDLDLRPCPSQALSKFVVQPLLDNSFSQKSHIDDLITCLNAKDQVIAKLLDKLEVAGMDASSIFPGAAGLRPSKHATVRDQAGSYVLGLSPFDEQQWRNRKNPDMAGIAFEKVVSDVFSDTLPSSKPRNGPGSVTRDWWNDLPEDFLVTSSGVSAKGHDSVDIDDEPNSESTAVDKTHSSISISELPASATISGSDGECDLAPEQGREETKDLKFSDRGDEETTDEESHLDSKPQHTSTSLQSHGAAAAKDCGSRVAEIRHVGQIGTGSRHPKLDQPGGLSPDESSRLRLSSAVDRNTQEHRSSPKPVSESATALPYKKPKLGVVGGHECARSHGQLSGNTSLSLELHSFKPIRNKIGGKQPSTVTSRQPSETVCDREQCVEEPREAEAGSLREELDISSESAARETSQESANRKREELKRDLAVKSEGPTRKKRRF